MSPYYTDDQVTLYHGHDLDVLRHLETGSVACCVTSPPYYGLRDYGVPGQRGLEATPAEYVAGLVQVFAELRRVLAADGTLWLNLGDCYASNAATANGRQGFESHRGSDTPTLNRDHQGRVAYRGNGIKAKDLMGIPWRVAFALQDDGWILRNDIIWAKPNAMPESVNDRLSSRHEHLFLLTKSRRYWFDLDPIRIPLIYPDAADGTRIFGGKTNGAGKIGSAYRTGGGMPHTYGAPSDRAPSRRARDGNTNKPNSATTPWQADELAGRNPGDVWTIPTSPFPDAHFAVMPQPLAVRCITAGCRPGGLVLDPYSGSGTTGLAATRLGRRYLGIDINAAYLELSLRTRLGQTTLLDTPEAT